MASLSYAQWFALLGMRFFGPEKPNRIIRHQTLKSLARLGLAVETPMGSFRITRAGVQAERAWEGEKARG